MLQEQGCFFLLFFSCRWLFDKKEMRKKLVIVFSPEKKIGTGVHDLFLSLQRMASYGASEREPFSKIDAPSLFIRLPHTCREEIVGLGILAAKAGFPYACREGNIASFFSSPGFSPASSLPHGCGEERSQYSRRKAVIRFPTCV